VTTAIVSRVHHLAAGATGSDGDEDGSAAAIAEDDELRCRKLLFADVVLRTRREERAIRRSGRMWVGFFCYYKRASLGLDE
jgi:hypothetical protein